MQLTITALLPSEQGARGWCGWALGAGETGWGPHPDLGTQGLLLWDPTVLRAGGLQPA